MSKGPKIRDIDYYEDLTGQTIGRLTIVSLDQDSPKRRWKCVCSCGNTVTKPLRIFGTALPPLVGALEKKKYSNRDGKIKRKMFGMKTFILIIMDITVWDILQIPTNHFMLMPKILTK